MTRAATTAIPNALLAFGRRVSAGDAFDDLVTERGWQMERWQPSFVEACDRERFLTAIRDRTACRETAWDDRQVLRRPPAELPPVGEPPPANEARLMIASARDLPTLYFVEWHYIDFVLSCVGNVSEASRVLGIRRSTLQRKRKKTPPTL